MSRKRPSAEKRFWSQVVKKGPDDCWAWLGSKAGTFREYGRVKFGERVESAHRVSWMLHNGPIPEGMEVCHKCDNAGCVNPAHLWLGTHGDNMRDMFHKGRANRAVGERTRSAKLNPDLVRDIRRRLASGESQSSIAEELHVSSPAISNINTGKSWKHV